MRVDDNYGGTTHYQPNSYNQWAEQPEYKEPPLELTGHMDAYEPKDNPTDDCFYQPGDLYRLMTPDKKDLLIENTIRNMDGVTENIKLRHAAHCYLADADYGTRLAAGLEVDLDEVIRLSQLTHDERMKATMLG